MADLPPEPESPDIMNDAAFNPAPIARRDTLSSKASDGGSERVDTCRICRSEGSPDEPLFYPCKCSGSIKFVHQECLMEWLSHSHKKHCELCKTPFRFTKLYDANMPHTLPWAVFLRRACVHVALMLARACRSLLVGFVWLGLIPWLIRWVWRCFFWTADAAWAREAFMQMMRASALQHEQTSNTNKFANAFQQFIKPAAAQDTAAPKFFTLASNMIATVFPEKRTESPVASQTSSSQAPDETLFAWPQADPSILSSWSYVSSLTSKPRLNRVILDVFEGQLITCVVIVGFILVFLIREWVVQQQPLVNLDNFGNVQQQLREAADRMQADNERLRRQEELLEQARRRLVDLQNEADHYVLDADMIEFIGWEKVEELMDNATQRLQNGGEDGHARFVSSAMLVTQQIRAAGRAGGESLDEFTEKVYQKLGSYSEDVRKEWEKVMMAEVEKAATARRERRAGRDVGDSHTESVGQTGDDELLQAGVSSSGPSSMRPPMPDRETSSRATQIQRVLAEAEEVLERPSRRADRDATASSRNPNSELSTMSNASSASAPSTESWQHVTPPNESARPSSWVDALSNGPTPTSREETPFEPMPITNAGPDAKVNIKRSGKGKMKAVPEPEIKHSMLDDDEALSKLKEEVAKETQMETRSDVPSPLSLVHGTQQRDEERPQHDVQSVDDTNNNNPFHPDGPPPTERRNSESFSTRVASVFREEFGFDDGPEDESLQQAGLGPDGEPATPASDESAESESAPPARRATDVNEAPQGLVRRVVDWFWGDIQAPNAVAPVPAAEEERQQDDEVQQAPFAPEGNDAPAVFVRFQDGQPNFEVPAPPPEPAPEQNNQAPQEHDPEVLAAAQQAGVDPEAVEDAEDLEGIFELIGLQGPLIGLFQTSAFCLLLVACTILGAVILPYFVGKLVLSLVSSPVYFLLKFPLQGASFIADFVIDVVLAFAGWFVMASAVVLSSLVGAARAVVPSLGDGALIEEMAGYAKDIAQNAFVRLGSLVDVDESTEGALAWSWAFLGWSVHSHASLRNIEDEINAVLAYTGAAVTWIVETVSSGSVIEVCLQSLSAVKHVTELPSMLTMSFGVFQEQYMQPLLGFFTSLSRGALTFSTPKIPMDPSLVYWNSTDRALAIFAGYTALAALAAIYVALDTPITRSESGRRTEKVIRDSLRQAGGVLKVILIISIEMLVFPLYCGMLLDIAFLPLFHSASVASRWDFAARKPYLFCFVHWFVGTGYMFHFALFVGMCRKILRGGVLWFIRDPDDPTFHPVRDVLERNVATQLRKIAFSALVYGALVILCLGGVIWTIGRLFEGIFPIHWTSTEPVLEFPMDLFLYNLVTPLVIRLFKPSEAVNVMYEWWLRRCARGLRLSHFLFDDRKKDEEGQFIHKSWSSLLLRKQPESPSEATGNEVQVSFQRNGKYVLTPCSDSYRPPKPGEAFLQVDEDDVYIADRDGKKNEHFSKVYVPPLFRLRMSAFMVCLWMFSAFTGLCATLVPLLFGRKLFAKVLPEGIVVNDIYAYSVGAYILGSAIFLALKSKAGVSYLRQKAAFVDVTAWIEPVKRCVVRTLKCAYVYGFIGLVLPTIFALLLQFYFILPLHTWAASGTSVDSTPSHAEGENSTMGANLTNLFQHSDHQTQPKIPYLPDHTFHILQDYALGLLYVRIATRLIFAAPASRGYAAFRQITADGYFNPNIRLATRFFVLPTLLLSAFVLVLPPVAAKFGLGLFRAFSSSDVAVALDAEARTKLYRYSYPLTASFVVVALGAAELAKATSRWRARIKDEVYLVGERLHNFGEKKPPVGSKSVVRKER